MAAHEPDRVRLDAALRARLPHLSRRDIRIAIDCGMVTVNGRRARKGSLVGSADRIDFGTLDCRRPTSPDTDIPILYEDGALLALNKPAGLPSVARHVGGRPSVGGYLLTRFPEAASAAPSPLDAGLVHRLDTGTSGVLLAARSRNVWSRLRTQFQRKLIEKRYLAVVHGRLERDMRLAHDLTHAPRSTGKMTVAHAGRSRGRRTWRAEAIVEPIAWGAAATLVAVRLVTGVTHQIRAQLAAVGHPLIGDTLYGGEPLDHLATERQLLHAASLRLDHPVSLEPLTIAAPPPSDFSEALERLGIDE